MPKMYMHVSIIDNKNILITRYLSVKKIPDVIIQCVDVLVWLTNDSSQSTSIKTELMNEAKISKEHIGCFS